ncbi:MAG: ribosome-associated translation inhibitor RaiA [Actinobacteria bacterium]|nr:MAG: ribosome-associated translation inhibitor RaiA [Actinomycetota bacterium]
MSVEVHGKNWRVPDELKEIADERVRHAARIFDDVENTDVEFIEIHNPRVADGRFRCEITSLVAGNTVRVEAAAADARAALDAAGDVYERQLLRLKERLIQRHRRNNHKDLNEPPGSVEEPADRGNLIVRRKRFAMRPMTSEEAALQMEMLGHDFFFFLDAESGKHCVLYHRRDGAMGLIEPE